MEIGAAKFLFWARINVALVTLYWAFCRATIGATAFGCEGHVGLTLAMSICWVFAVIAFHGVLLPRLLVPRLVA